MVWSENTDLGILSTETGFTAARMEKTSHGIGLLGRGAHTELVRGGQKEEDSAKTEEEALRKWKKCQKQSTVPAAVSVSHTTTNPGALNSSLWTQQVPN